MRVLRIFPFTTNIIIAIFVLCFINVPDTPLQNISLIDKWTHIILYLCLGVCIALEYFNAYGYSGAKKLALWVFLMPSLMGGLIEILQAYCTGGNRSGEWLDFLADTIGAAIAFVIGILVAKYRARS